MTSTHYHPYKHHAYTSLLLHSILNSINSYAYLHLFDLFVSAMCHTNDEKGIVLTDSSHWERQRSQHKITMSYIWYKHMCHGAHRDEGTQILEVRKIA